MFSRLLSPPRDRSFFLFGARGTGKTTLLQRHFRGVPQLWIDLLDPDEEDRYLKRPAELISVLDHVRKTDPAKKWVVIDEIQKAPRLLDVVHSKIAKREWKFALTGSSARKLKRAGANLLGGRAATFELHPLTHLEVGDAFRLAEAMQWGTLPEIQPLNDTDRRRFLRTYTQTYLKEEIQAEQLARRLDAFRNFLDVAAQMNGRVLNMSAVARDVGVEMTTIQGYYGILTDTWVGYKLPGWDRSVRKQQMKSPKFYFFDPGVVRSLRGCAHLPLVESTSEFGEFFEHWVILEFFRLNSLLERDFRLSYLLTKDGAEIDLVVERPRETTALIEIKSATQIRPDHLRALRGFTGEFPKTQSYCLSRDPVRKIIDGVECLPWQAGIKEILGISG